MERGFPLSGVEAGGSAVLVSLEVPEGEWHRLKSLGFCEGQRIRVLRAGDRMIVELLGTHIGIDRRIAAHLRVVRLKSLPCKEALRDVAAQRA